MPDVLFQEDGRMARVTGEGPHSHVYEEDEFGTIVAGWCLGDRPWEPSAVPVPADRAHVVLGQHTDCPHHGDHDPVKLL
jgi:hypothetical protein